MVGFLKLILILVLLSLNTVLAGNFLFDNFYYSKSDSDSITFTCKYFDFDPNFVTYQQLIKLGFTAKQTESFLDDREHGKKFYCINDVKNYYLFKNKFSDLESCIKIDFEKIANGNPLYNLNELSFSDFEKLGLFSKREIVQIIELRSVLGAFYSVGQLRDIKTIDFQKFNEIKQYFYVCTPDSFNTLKINEISAQQLEQHPYFSHKQSLAVVDYRSKHIKISCAADLLAVGCFSAVEVKKIIRYLEF